MKDKQLFYCAVIFGVVLWTLLWKLYGVAGL